MQILTGMTILIATVVAMEGVALAIHKYVMHGPGWAWHRSHHESRGLGLETNDLYAVLFAGIAGALIVFTPPGFDALFWIGLGMTTYGALYFVVHDGLVHGRWPLRIVPKTAYLKRLVQAHRLHHAVESREGCVSFGFLYAPNVRGLRNALQSRRARLPDDAPP